MQSVCRDIQQLQLHLKQFKKIFLVHGQSFNKSLMRPMFEQMNVIHFTEFYPNPTYAQVCNGVKIFVEESCDVIVAIGGGSAIDVAKSIKLFGKMDHTKDYLRQEKIDSDIYFIAIPTTGGTGSEATKFAVIYDQGEKLSVSHECLIPNYVALLPQLLKSLSLYQKKCTLLDALCQSIESWWSVSSTKESIEYSKKSIELIIENYLDYLEKNCDKAATNILEASYLSGKAINITTTTAAHAMSYKLTSLYQLPHGHSVSLCLDKVWKFMIENTYKARGYTEEKLISILKDIEELIDLKRFHKLLMELNMVAPQSKTKSKDIITLVSSVNEERLQNFPVKLNAIELTGLYEEIVQSE